jgi:hypothetical protein
MRKELTLPMEMADIAEIWLMKQCIGNLRNFVSPLASNNYYQLMH